jgi:AcrR family transcriptional regulator
MSPRRAKALAGRVGDDPAAALRVHLLDAAAALIARAPLATITTREIARSAGVSDGVLYNYFHDKNDLLVEALVRRLRHSIESATARLPDAGTGTVEANLTSIATTLFELEGEVIPMIAGLLSDPTLLHRMFTALHEDPLGPQWFRAPLVAYVDAERRLGRIRADADPDALTLVLTGSTAVLALTGQVAPGSAGDVSGRVAAVVGQLMRGLRPD